MKNVFFAVIMTAFAQFSAISSIQAVDSNCWDQSRDCRSRCWCADHDRRCPSYGYFYSTVAQTRAGGEEYELQFTGEKSKDIELIEVGTGSGVQINRHGIYQVTYGASTDTLSVLALQLDGETLAGSPFNVAADGTTTNTIIVKIPCHHTPGVLSVINGGTVGHTTDGQLDVVLSFVRID